MGWFGQSDVLTALAQQRLTNKKPQDVFAESGHSKDVLTLLVLGCDEERYYAPPGQEAKQILNAAARSDMMLVARMDFANNKISGISIPRDLHVSDPALPSTDKINAYHKLGGPEMAQKAAEAALGNMVRIDRTFVINYEAFKEMVDLLGGIEIYVPRNMAHKDVRGGLVFDIKKGRQLLDGYHAMCFVRYRKGDSDFKRQERQKDFMLAFKDKLTKNMSVAPQIADKSLKLAGGVFNSSEIAALMLFAQRVGGDNIKMGMVPILERPGSTVLDVDTNKLPDVLAEYGFIQAPNISDGIRN